MHEMQHTFGLYTFTFTGLFTAGTNTPNVHRGVIQTAKQDGGIQWVLDSHTQGMENTILGHRRALPGVLNIWNK